MFRAKQHLSCIISQLFSPWAPVCIFFYFCFLLHFDFIVCALAFTFYFIFLLALFFFIFANGLCCFNFLCALFLFYKWFALLQLSFALLWFPMCCLTPLDCYVLALFGSHPLLDSCITLFGSCTI